MIFEIHNGMVGRVALVFLFQFQFTTNQQNTKHIFDYAV